jgi:hypothetical protein
VFLILKAQWSQCASHSSARTESQNISIISKLQNIKQLKKEMRKSVRRKKNTAEEARYDESRSRAAGTPLIHPAAFFRRTTAAVHPDPGIHPPPPAAIPSSSSPPFPSRPAAVLVALLTAPTGVPRRSVRIDLSVRCIGKEIHLLFFFLSLSLSLPFRDMARSVVSWTISSASLSQILVPSFLILRHSPIRLLRISASLAKIVRETRCPRGAAAAAHFPIFLWVHSAKPPILAPTVMMTLIGYKGVRYSLCVYFLFCSQWQR